MMKRTLDNQEIADLAEHTAFNASLAYLLG